MQELIREPINTNLLQRYIDEWLSHVNTTHNWKRLHQILSNLLMGVVSATDTHIGSTNLTLTSNRLLSGDGNNFNIEDLGYFTVISNNDMIFGTSANFNTIGASYYINVTGDYILNLPSATNAPVGAPLLNQTFGVGDVEFANYGFPTSLSGMDNGKMLVYNSTINQFVTQSLGVVTNIYNSDGTLAGNRIVNGDNHNLSFLDNFQITFEASNQINFNLTDVGEFTFDGYATYFNNTQVIFNAEIAFNTPLINQPTPLGFLTFLDLADQGVVSYTTLAEVQTALGIALTSGYVAFGNGAGTGIIGEAGYEYTAATKTLQVNKLLITGGNEVSISPLHFTGTWYAAGTATTSKPHLLLEPTGTTSTNWDLVGTAIGANAATGFLGKLIDLQKTAVSMFSVNYRGDTRIGRSITYGQAGAATGSFPITNANGTPDSSGTNYQFSNSTTTQSATAGAFSIFGSTFAQTSGNQYFNLITSSFGAAAGSASYRPFGLLYTINNSGAQSGTATGIFVNATETALNSMTHNLMDLQVGGFSQFKVSNVGFGTFSGGLTLSGTFQTLSSVANASFAVRHGNGFQNTADYSLGGSAGIMGKIAIAGSASGTATANYSAASFIISTLTMNRSASGTHPIFANAAIRPLTINTGAGALTNAATVYIGGAATGTGIPTNNYALWVDSGASRFDGVVNLAAYTVGTLPTGTRGDKAYVTDALAPTYGAAAVGGGAVIIPVFHNGTTWITA
jgi:hypothetical protein